MNSESTADIFELRPPLRFASQGDLLRYTERTRRQLDRFEKLSDGKTIDASTAARIRRMCDELDADIIMSLPAN